ncbi:DUF6265 family protein [Taibaiella chishuiensis]|nr:DUF6265 family protein [Taibaiella chishuiensis]
MKAKLFTMIGLCAALVAGARPPQHNGMNDLQWLAGIWENKTPRGSIYESWQKTNDSVMTGRSYRLKDGDTLVFEEIRIVSEQGQLFYIPVVKNQNGGQPVRFRLVSASDSGMVFENPQHDFPQRITYNRTGSDALVAAISGKVAGKERKQQFPMKKIQ